MAVNINIPNYGTVTAENAATESTLMELVRLLATSERRNTDFNNKAGKSLNETARGAAQTSVAMASVASNTRSASKATDQFASVMSQRIAEISNKFPVTAGIVGQLGDGLKTLALTVARTSLAYATNYKTLSTDPVGVAAGTLGTGIDLATSAIAGIATATGNFIGAIVDKIPLMGTLLGDFTRGLGNAGAAVAQIVGGILNQLNNLFAAELRSTIESFRTLSKMGATFANGMMEMRVSANVAGLTIEQFTAGVQSANSSIRNIGLTFAGGAQLVAETNQQFSLLKTGSQTLRNQLLSLGYSFEEQVELSADFIASVRAGTTAGKMQNMSTAELARGTRAYAEDLRVLQSLTKEDAKQAQERARRLSLEADVLAQLDPEAAARFQGVLRAMPAELQKGFLEQLSLGTVIDATTNIVMSQNARIGETFNQLEDTIRNTNLTAGQAQDQMAEGRARIAREQEAQARQGNVAINIAARGGASGIAQSVASMVNGIISGTLNDPDAVKLSREATTRQARAMDQLTGTTNDLIEQSQLFSTSMESRILNHLPVYSELLSLVNTTMTTFLLGGLDKLGVRELDPDTMTISGYGSGGGFEAVLQQLHDLVTGASDEDAKDSGNDSGNKSYRSDPFSYNHGASLDDARPSRLADISPRQVYADNSSEPEVFADATETTQNPQVVALSKLANNIETSNTNMIGKIEELIIATKSNQAELVKITTATSDTEMNIGKLVRNS